VLESIPAPSGPNGLHIEFNGSRWYNAGPPRAFAENEFVEIGSYAGFPVYRLRNETQDRIWVLVVPGGALAQYSRR
jgi:hypothetical protein